MYALTDGELQTLTEIAEALRTASAALYTIRTDMQRRDAPGTSADAKYTARNFEQGEYGGSIFLNGAQAQIDVAIQNLTDVVTMYDADE
jgi:hypothetical protein